MVNNVRTVNNLNGDLVLITNQNLSVSDNGSDTITLTGPDLTSFVTSSELDTELNTVSGTLQTQIDGIDNHSRYTDSEAVTATDAARTTLSSTLSNEIDSDISTHSSAPDAHHTRYTDGEAVTATDAARTSLSGTLQTQIDGKADSVHTHDASDVVTGTFVDGRISQSSVVQHQSAFDHGSIPGLGDDDHPHYTLVDGSRAFTSTVGGVDPVAITDLATKNYVDGQIVTLRNEMLTVSGSLQTEIDQLRTDLEVCCPLIPAPVVSSFTPTSGMVGTVVTIIGTDFTAATDVTFDATPATTFMVDSDLQITATVPAGAATGLVQVTTPAGSGSSATLFTVIPPSSGQEVSIDLDGSNEFFAKSTEVDIGIGNIWTISGWVNPASLSESYNFIRIDSGVFPPGNNIAIREKNGGGLMEIRLEISGATVFKDYEYNNFFPTENVWYLVVITWDGTNLKMYRDGTEVMPTTKQVDLSGTMTSTTRIIGLGTDIFNPTIDTWRGKAYSYAVWNTALSDLEVAAIYNLGDGRFDLATDNSNYTSSLSLLHWWRLGLDSNDIGKDYGTHTTLIDVLDDATGIDAADIVNDYPGM